MIAVGGRPSLFALERHAVVLPEGLVERALGGLLARGHSEGGWTTGCALGVEDEVKRPAAVNDLDRLLRAELVDSIARRHRCSLALSLMKAGDGEPPDDPRDAWCQMSRLEGAASIRPGHGLFRVLINLSGFARRVVLGTEGEVLIPARRCGAVHALHFWSSELPHRGMNDRTGYFLASYSGVARR